MPGLAGWMNLGSCPWGAWGEPWLAEVWVRERRWERRGDKAHALAKSRLQCIKGYFLVSTVEESFWNALSASSGVGPWSRLKRDKEGYISAQSEFIVFFGWRVKHSKGTSVRAADKEFTTRAGSSAYCAVFFSFSFFFKLREHSHKMYHFKAFDLVAFSTFAVFCPRRFSVVPKHLDPKENPSVH